MVVAIRFIHVDRMMNNDIQFLGYCNHNDTLAWNETVAVGACTLLFPYLLSKTAAAKTTFAI
jgi:hypothetical protein